MYRTASVTAPDGVRLAVYEWGDPAGAEILFVHGFSQSALAWRRQMESPTLARFRGTLSQGTQRTRRFGA